jgi:CheY-like chemotaxis protein
MDCGTDDASFSRMNQAPILIIEDDENIRIACRELLESEGFEVDMCSNGEEALAFLARHRDPCLILLDMLMPVMGGREFMSELEKQPHTIVPIPVYLVSASASQEDGKKMGCRGFLKKPFDIDALLAIVQSHCKVNDCKRKDAQAVSIPPVKMRTHLAARGFGLSANPE